MLAHLHGRVWSAADVARSPGVSDETARRLVDLPALRDVERHPRLGAPFGGFALEHLWVLHPGPRGYDLDERIPVVPVTEIGTLRERNQTRSRRRGERLRPRVQ